MGAWIEIFALTPAFLKALCRTPRWVRGLKFGHKLNDITFDICRTPRWVRGLKFLLHH